MYFASTLYLMVCQLSLWSFYSCTYKCLTLEMSFRRNLTLQRRSPMKLLLLFVFQALLSFSGFLYLRIFLSISNEVLHIRKNVNLENTFKAETFPSCLGCWSPCQAHAAPTCTHWSWLARVRMQWARLGASSPHLARHWHMACHHVPPQWELYVGFGAAVIRRLW